MEEKFDSIVPNVDKGVCLYGFLLFLLLLLLQKQKEVVWPVFFWRQQLLPSTWCLISCFKCPPRLLLFLDNVGT